MKVYSLYDADNHEVLEYFDSIDDAYSYLMGNQGSSIKPEDLYDDYDTDDDDDDDEVAEAGEGAEDDDEDDEDDFEEDYDEYDDEDDDDVDGYNQVSDFEDFNYRDNLEGLKQEMEKHRTATLVDCYLFLEEVNFWKPEESKSS